MTGVGWGGGGGGVSARERGRVGGDNISPQKGQSWVAASSGDRHRLYLGDKYSQ